MAVVSDEVTSRNATALASAIAWTAVAAPSGTADNFYWWARVGNIIVGEIILNYANAGTTVTQVTVEKPADMPNPFEFTGLTANSSAYVSGSSVAYTTPTGTGGSGRYLFRKNSGGTAYEFVSIQSSGSYRMIHIPFQYLAA
jgi:hypothetical protein